MNELSESYNPIDLNRDEYFMNEAIREAKKALRNDEDLDEEERQREEAERALAGPVQVDVVRAARLRRLAGEGEIS